MAIKEQQWMTGEWDCVHHYSAEEWMKGAWNGDFFYELNKLGVTAVIKFCVENGLITDRYECPKCGEDMKLVDCVDVNDGKTWACRKKGTNAHQIRRSVRKGTWFDNSKMSMGRVLRLTYMWLNKMLCESIQNDLGVGKQTVVDWFNCCRDVCMDECLRFNGMIGGVDRIVEITELMSYKKEHAKDKHIKEKLMFGAVERNSNAYFFEVVENRNADVLLNVIRKRILPGTTVVSDCWSSYKCLENYGFVLMTINSNLIFKNLEEGTHISAIDGSWRSVKRSLKGTHHISGVFDGYLAEYLWRREHKTDISTQVKIFFDAIKKSFPPQVKDINP